jgi:hypothetical protein
MVLQELLRRELLPWRLMEQRRWFLTRERMLRNEGEEVKMPIPR